jgi:hypothetical protein
VGGYTLILFICLNFQLSYSQSTFKGKPCDDTEVRNYAGLPAWKNYGEWLSECDSLEDAWEDSVFAEMSLKKQLREEEEKRIRDEEIANMDFDEELDMDAMWDNTVWNEITDIAESEGYEVENITATAGVRGAEAEDDALALLYYRRSMKGLSKLDLQRALGKLIIKRQKMSDDSDTEKIDSYIYQLKIKLKNT